MLDSILALQQALQNVNATEANITLNRAINTQTFSQTDIANNMINQANSMLAR